jgi:hypothetical protein
VISANSNDINFTYLGLADVDKPVNDSLAGEWAANRALTTATAPTAPESYECHVRQPDSTYSVDSTPDSDTRVPSWSPVLFFQLLLGACGLLFAAPATMIRAIFGDTNNGGHWHNTRLAILLGIIAVLSIKVMALDATVSADVYFCKPDMESAGPADFEWCSDTGTNRFVTNDENDFLPTSVTNINTKVCVGNGSYTCTKKGTVLVKSAAGQVIACTNVLYMPNCGKKLMPATQFIRKGCTLTLYTATTKSSCALKRGR